MTKIDDAVAAEATIAEQAWTTTFEAVMGEIAECFPRRDSRLLAGEVVRAMLMEIEDHNCWSLGEAVGHSGPHRLQHFFSRGAWDREQAREKIAAHVTVQLADDQGVLIFDETGDEKSSTDCVGAARQYSGVLGGIGLCQVAVHLTYATRHGHALIDRRLYLPATWAEDEERRLLRHVPDETCFATKPTIAAQMLTHAHTAGMKARWITGDEVYGSIDLRRHARTLGYDYALAIKFNQYLTTGAGRHTATALAGKIPRRAWARMRTGGGSKDTRHDDWALLDVHPDDDPTATEPAHADIEAPTHGGHGGHAMLVIRRHRYTRQLSFYRCHSATPAALADLVAVICTRWRIEEDFEEAKQLAGLDQGQTICWTSWMRWTLISLIATAILTLTQARLTTETPIDLRAVDLVPLSTAELLTICRITVIGPPRRDRDHVLAWSTFRRRHQYRAAQAHQRWNNITAEATT